MHSLIYIIIGAVGGILFAVAYPEFALSINDKLTPILQDIVDSVS